MTQSSKIKLSIVVICYNMQREITRTLYSLLPPYQQGFKQGEIEIILVDNGSIYLPELGDLQNKVKFYQYEPSQRSPVSAINFGLSMASSKRIGVFIDGARMATPGLCHQVIQEFDKHQRVFISTLAYHLGPNVQMRSIFKGYCKEVEDKILSTIDWKNQGYNLYLGSVLALSSRNGLHGSIAESNAVFLTQEMWKEVGAYDEKFKCSGGGLANLDFYKRAGNLPNIKLIRLANEATFHQIHGGVATNNKEGIHNEEFGNEYKNIRGKDFSPCQKIPELSGKLNPHVQYFYSKQEDKAQFDAFYAIQSKLNKLLSTDTDGLSFDYAEPQRTQT